MENHGRPVVLKKCVLRFDSKVYRVSFCRRGRGTSFHVEAPKTEKEREPRVESIVTAVA